MTKTPVLEENLVPLQKFVDELGLRIVPNILNKIPEKGFGGRALVDRQFFQETGIHITAYGVTAKRLASAFPEYATQLQNIAGACSRIQKLVDQTLTIPPDKITVDTSFNNRFLLGISQIQGQLVLLQNVVLGLRSNLPMHEAA